jgi:membrane protein DedA with SNARE-associated domain
MLGQYLFLRHGVKVVFLSRFVAVLRVLAAVLAGINRMDWRRFLLANAAGAILWASVVGFGAYSFGRAVTHVTGPLGVVLVVIGLAALVGALLFARAGRSWQGVGEAGTLRTFQGSSGWRPADERA